MKRLRLGAVLHFLIAIGHVGCLFALDEAFEAYGIREIMHQMVSVQISDYMHPAFRCMTTHFFD